MVIINDKVNEDDTEATFHLFFLLSLLLVTFIPFAIKGDNEEIADD